MLGRPDFLIRAALLPAPDGEQRPAGDHYEVLDAKLARSAKARAVAQIGFYSDLLAGAQGIRPRWMHLALGDGEFTSLKVDDYAAYERQARRLLTAFIADDDGENPPSVPYPEPVEHCVICRWSELCAGRRRRDDDLSLIAGITAGQRRALKDVGVMTRRGFADLAELPALGRVSRASLAGAQSQARLQVASEDAGHIEYELLEPERDAAGTLVANRGLLALPEPVVGDLFFDIEGARVLLRRESITADLRARAARFEQRYGRAPSQRELAQLAQASNFKTRNPKHGALDLAQLHAGWADKLARTLGVSLASVAPSVWHGATGRAAAHAPGAEAERLPELELARATQKAVALAQQEKSTWTRADAIKYLGRVLPAPGWTRPRPLPCWKTWPTGRCARSSSRSPAWKRPSRPKSRAACCAPTGAASTSGTAASGTPRARSWSWKSACSPKPARAARRA